MTKLSVIGGAVTRFANHPDRNMKSLAEEAVTGALKWTRKEASHEAL